MVRLSRNLSENEVAEQLGCSPRMVKHIEAGVTVISAAIVCRLSDVLNASVDEMLAQDKVSNIRYLSSVA